MALAAPTVRGGVQVVYGNNNWATTVQGVTPDYMTLRDYTMLSGQFFTTQDVDAAAKTAVLGETVAENLFGDSDPTGQVVIIKNVPFTVAGVLTPKGQSPTGQDQDDVILLPISTATQKVLGANKANAKAVGTLMVQAMSPQAMDQAIQEMEALLRERHRILPGLEDDFTIRNLTEVFAAQETSAQGHVDSARRDRVGVADRRRHRHHEHHAGVGHRTDARDRPAAGRRRQDAGHPLAVPGRSRDARRLSAGSSGSSSGVTASLLISHFAQWSTEVSLLSILTSFLFSAARGRVLRLLPGTQGGVPESD